jgi:glutamate--cysteine ligase
VDPFEPVGIAVETGRFLDAFLLYCVLEESPFLTDLQSQLHARNFARTVKEGRRPDLTLTRDGAEVPLRDWANELLDRIAPLAALLDQDRDDGAHAQALAHQRAKVADPDLTPSARVLAEVRAAGSFQAFGQRMTEQHAAHFRADPLMPVEEQVFAEMAAASLAEQRAMEAADTVSFDAFVAAYNSSRLCGERRD